MTTALVILDGLSDRPHADLGGQTPLAAALTPVLDRLAQTATVGRFQPTPKGREPGSEVGLFACLGVTPPGTPRAPLEALGRGIPINGDWAWRLTRVAVSGPIDVSGTVLEGLLPEPPDGAAALAVVAEELARIGLRLFPDPGGRHLLLGPVVSASPIAPHQLSGLPVGSGGKLPANVPWRRIQQLLGGECALWPWGGGAAGAYQEKTGYHSLICGVDLACGIGAALGLRRISVPTATGDTDTDLAAKAQAAQTALANGRDVVIHVEGPDMAAHRRDARGKADCIARIDRELLAPLAECGARLLVTADHGTDSRTGRHLADPVPYLLWNRSADGPGGKFNEAAVAAMPALDIAAWHNLMWETPLRCG